MSFQISYDFILNLILTDWQNQFPEADTSQGSLIYFKSSVLASVTWGLYNNQEWISKQIFPDTADSNNLDHHAWIQGISRNPGESDASLLARLLSVIRQPPAGGNKLDYERWAKEITNVADAWCFGPEDGTALGTVDVVIIAVEGSAGDAGSGIPTSALIDEVQAYIDSVRPVTASTEVKAPSILSQDVTMTVSGSADTTAITSEITNYLNGFEPNQVLYVSQLISIAIQNGADNAVVSTPSGDVSPTNYQMIRAGTISVS